MQIWNYNSHGDIDNDSKNPHHSNASECSSRMNDYTHTSDDLELGYTDIWWRTARVRQEYQLEAKSNWIETWSHDSQMVTSFLLNFRVYGDCLFIVVNLFVGTNMSGLERTAKGLVSVPASAAGAWRREAE